MTAQARPSRSRGDRVLPAARRPARRTRQRGALASWVRSRLQRSHPSVRSISTAAFAGQGRPEQGARDARNGRPASALSRTARTTAIAGRSGHELPRRTDSSWSSNASVRRLVHRHARPRRASERSRRDLRRSGRAASVISSVSSLSQCAGPAFSGRARNGWSGNSSSRSSAAAAGLPRGRPATMIAVSWRWNNGLRVWLDRRAR